MSTKACVEAAYYSYGQAANYCGLSVRTLADLVRRKKVEAYLVGRRRLFPRSALDRLVRGEVKAG